MSMFEATQNTDSSALRQGDILRNIPLFGAVPLDKVQVPGSLLSPEADENGGGKTVLLNKYLIMSDAAVLSHCCELDRVGNGIKVTGVIIAPIRDVNKATAPGKIQELIDSNIINDSTQHSYLKYFYLPQFADGTYPKGSVIDFSKAFSLSKSAYDHLLTKKILQMTDEYRSSMSFKLALYFHRMKAG